MTDWTLIGTLIVSVCVLQHIGWRILRKIELIYQRVGWIQEYVQKMRKLGETQA